MIEGEGYKPLIENPLVRIYQKGEKYLIISDKEITFQTLTTIKKRKR